MDLTPVLGQWVFFTPTIEFPSPEEINFLNAAHDGRMELCMYVLLNLTRKWENMESKRVFYSGRYYMKNCSDLKSDLSAFLALVGK